MPEGTLSDGSSAYIGVNGTKARGWEMDVNGEILPGWTVNAGYTHVKVTRAATDLLYANPPRTCCSSTPSCSCAARSSA